MSFYQSGFYQPGFYNPGFYNRQAGDSLPTLSAPFYSDYVVRVSSCFPADDKGCSLIHYGRRTPTFEQGFAVGGIGIVFFSWEDGINSNETISSSTWELPDNMTGLAEARNQEVTDNTGQSYLNANALRFDCGSVSGTYQVTNIVTTSRNGGAGRTIKRTVNINVYSYI